MPTRSRHGSDEILLTAIETDTDNALHGFVLIVPFVVTNRLLQELTNNSDVLNSLFRSIPLVLPDYPHLSSRAVCPSSKSEY